MAVSRQPSAISGQSSGKACVAGSWDARPFAKCAKGWGTHRGVGFLTADG